MVTNTSSPGGVTLQSVTQHLGKNIPDINQE